MGIAERYQQFQSNVLPEDENVSSGTGDIASRFQQSQQSQQPQISSDVGQILQTQIQKQNSAVNLIDRAFISIGDEPGIEDFLRNEKGYNIVQKLPNGKFIAGNDQNNLLPVDPEGIAGDFLGDLADFTGLVLPIVGQIYGAMLGATAGSVVPGAGTAAGIITGGVFGAAAGETGNVILGKLAGTRKITLDDLPADISRQVGDVLITSAYAAAGEGIAAGLGMLGKAANKNILPKFANFMRNATKKSADPGRLVKGTANILNVTAKLDKQGFIDASLYNWVPLDNPKYINPDFIHKTLIPGFIDDVISKDTTLGKSVGVGKRWATRYFGNKSLELRQTSRSLLNTLANPKAGIVTSSGKLNKAAFVETKDAKLFEQVSKLFFGKTRDGRLLPKNLKLKEYLAFKERMQPALKKFFEGKTKSKTVENAFAKYFAEVDEVAKIATTKSGVITQAEQLSNPFISSNRAFSEWKSDLTLLKANGLDITDIKGLGKLKRGDRIFSTKIESFTKGLQEKGSSAQGAFNEVVEKLPTKFKGGGIGGEVGTWFDELKKFNAAQDFSKTNIDLLRFGMLTTILGSFGIFRGEIPKPWQIAGAALLGTPAGIKTLIRSRKIPEVLLKGTIQATDNRTTVSILTNLIRSAQQSNGPQGNRI